MSNKQSVYIIDALTDTNIHTQIQDQTHSHTYTRQALYQHELLSPAHFISLYLSGL